MVINSDDWLEADGLPTAENKKNIRIKKMLYMIVKRVTTTWTNNLSFLIDANRG
jgi:hypothetical protein